MPIAKGPPESGFRVVLERVSTEPLAYEGRVETSAKKYEVRATEDEVSGAPHDLAEKVRLLLRAAIRHAKNDGRPAPDRIARWRP